jgi:hypothetical protein
MANDQPCSGSVQHPSPLGWIIERPNLISFYDEEGFFYANEQRRRPVSSIQVEVEVWASSSVLLATSRRDLVRASLMPACVFPEAR